MKIFFILSIYMAGYQLSWAQQLPNIIPPSPQSQQFFKHLDFPSGNSSGTVNYSIPIYEIKSGSLSLPVSLNYMSGGSKAGEIPGDIGYGWTLNAGGRISRTIYGKPDELYSFPSVMKIINSNEEADDNFDYVASLYQSIQGNSNLPIHDSEYDIYSYSFGKESGKFIYKQDEAKDYMIPEKPYVANFGSILDDKGVSYLYNTVESVQVSVGSFGSFPTSKLLNYIISADKKDTISISYQQLVNQTSTSTAATVTAYDDFTSAILADTYSSLPLTTAASVFSEVRTYVVWTVKEIRFRGGKLVFTLNSANDAIDLIKVIDSKGALVKQVQLLRSGGNGYLTNVRFNDIAGANRENYGFEYYPGSGGAYQQDFYGYLYTPGGLVPRHTGYYSTSNLIYPPIIAGFTAGTGGSVIPSTEAMVGMLKKVTYPSGGTMEYSYELNRAQSGPVGDVVNSGGMRLLETKLTDFNGNVHYRSYRYGTNECGYGKKRMMVPYNTEENGYDQISYEIRVFPWLVTGYPDHGYRGSSYRMRVYTSNFLPQVAEVGQEATFYPEVTEYDGTSNNNIGKTVYRYNSVNDGSRYTIGDYPTYGSFPYYPGDFATGNTFFTGVNSDFKLWPRSHIQQFDLWRSFPLEETTVYKNKAGIFEPVRKVKQIYNTAPTNTFTGLHIIRNIQASMQPFYEGSGDSYAAMNFKLPVFLYDNYYITTGREDLTSTTETLYTPTGNVVTTTSYEYNGSQQVIKIKKTSSSGEDVITTYSYPADQGATQPYVKMVANNVISPVIEEKTYKDANFLQSTKTDYSFWDNSGQPTTTVTDRIYPKLVSTKRDWVAYEPRLEYLGYDNTGNLTSAHQLTGPHTSYVWGYNKQYPIAEAKNAPLNNIFHENFEEGAGNSARDKSKTGHYSKTNGTFTKSLTGLDAGSYVLRYWKKSGTGKWTLQTSNVTVTGGSYSISIGATATEWIDDVCFYPQSAQMSTYTYDALVGMTSATDVRGETTYYEYDSFQRLMNVKDKDGKIIKHHDYHYKN